MAEYLSFPNSFFQSQCFSWTKRNCIADNYSNY